MKIAIICVGVVTLRFRTVPPHGSSNKTRVNRAMPHHRLHNCMVCFVLKCFINYYFNNPARFSSRVRLSTLCWKSLALHAFILSIIQYLDIYTCSLVETKSIAYVILFIVLLTIQKLSIIVFY